MCRRANDVQISTENDACCSEKEAAWEERFFHLEAFFFNKKIKCCLLEFLYFVSGRGLGNVLPCTSNFSNYSKARPCYSCVTVYSDKGLTLETSVVHQTSRAKNMPYQPLLIKNPFTAHSPTQEKQDFFQNWSSMLYSSDLLWGLRPCGNSLRRKKLWCGTLGINQQSKNSSELSKFVCVPKGQEHWYIFYPQNDINIAEKKNKKKSNFQEQLRHNHRCLRCNLENTNLNHSDTVL